MAGSAASIGYSAVAAAPHSTISSPTARASTSPYMPRALVPVASLAELEAALPKIRAERRTSVIVIITDPAANTSAGGAWWDVAVPEVSNRAEVTAARAAYDAARTQPRAIG